MGSNEVAEGRRSTAAVGHNAGVPSDPAATSPASAAYQRFVAVLVDLGREQLRGQLDGSKQWDAKALGFLTAIGAFGSIVAANHAKLGRGWVVALVLLGVGAVGCALTLIGRDYDIGPNIRAAHDTYGGLGEESLPMLVAELHGSLSHNRSVGTWKGRFFSVAIVSAVAALVTIAISWSWLR